MRKRGLAVEQHHDGAGGGGGSVPTLDEIAENPRVVAGMSVEQVTALMTRCAVVQSVLATRLVSLMVTGSSPRATMDSTAERMLTVPEVAGRLTFKPAYVYELIRLRRLPAVRHGKYVRVRESDLVAWIESKKD